MLAKPYTSNAFEQSLTNTHLMIHQLRLTSLLACFFFTSLGFCHAEVVETDVCVYGGTASGITAAVQVAKQGKSVVLLEYGQHLGGMTSGGLGATDIGNKDVIGGLSRKFYQRVAKHYANDSAWTQESREDFFAYRSKRTKLSEVQGKDATMWTFEPHVAMRILKEMLDEASVPVRMEQPVTLVKKEGNRIVEIMTKGGDIFRAKMFIDATYEGDLMAKADVSYRVGREANAAYNETLNGIREKTPKNQIFDSVDPYVIPGDSTSGLIPLVQRGSGGIPGDGDQRVQAYNFRLCFTNIPENRRKLDPPANYDPALYELAARRAEAIVAKGEEPNFKQFCNPVWMPNGKTDINNGEGISTDFIGNNYDYPDADYATRAKIWQAHEDYVRGFWYFMSTSPRVPEKLRNHFLSFGPSKDEFHATNGFSPQLYVREARRMVSDYVMTEHNCRSKEIVEDSVAMAAYGMDSHNCQRIVQDGAARNEGDVQQHGLKPYPISYRSIVPKSDECENLLVPVCVSATHIAFGSIRMEPVFMVLGQSAAIAATMSIDQGCAVQDLEYEQLRIQLLANGQVLKRTPKPKVAKKNPIAKAPKIVCFGDSITKRGYPQELARILKVEVANAGVAGHTTRQALRRFQKDVLDHKPEIVVIAFATNDARLAEEKVHVPLDLYESNLSKIITSCLEAGMQPVLCTVPPIDQEAYFMRHEQENFVKAGGLEKVLEGYRAVVLRLAKIYNVPVVDLYRLLPAESGWRHNDGVHTSDKGNRIIARLVSNEIQKLPPRSKKSTVTNEKGAKADRKQPVRLDSFPKDQPVDVVVYGGTSSGVIAAIQVARMGKSVVLVEPGNHVGGMTTGGLGSTDTGKKETISGVAREFYQNIQEWYKNPEHWKYQTVQEFTIKENGRRISSDAMFVFEPHVAEIIFHQMLSDAGVPVVFGERLDLEKGVQKNNGRIDSIRMESGRLFSAKVFLDCSYEGDLMAEAGVAYTFGREGNAKYGEEVNGVNTEESARRGKKPLDPFVIPGKPSSGLIRGLQADVIGNEGDGDSLIQAYNYRLCLTDHSANKVPFEKPDGYDEQDFELLFRWLEVGGSSNLPLGLSVIPNAKTDSNKAGWISTDYIGHADDYPDSDYATRDQIIDDHVRYTKGLLWTLANHPRIPEKIRRKASAWGFAKDEFLDNDHFPRQLYVREARRMVGAMVMTEHELRKRHKVIDPIGVGSYGMDSHPTQLWVDKQGALRADTPPWTGVGPYGISYRALTPKAEECKNLLVPVCLSASHSAIGSLRMEPVYMMLGQSAATAAVLAGDDIAVQDVPYQKLRQQLLSDGQIPDPSVKLDEVLEAISFALPVAQ